MPTPEEIANDLVHAKVGFLAQQLSAVALGYPDVLLGLYGTLGEGRDIPVHIKRRDGSLYGIDDIERILRAARNLPGFGLGADFLKLVPRFVSERLGDDLTREGLMRSDVPLLQFIRHLRNASAHGNRWSFTSREPRHPAMFRTFQLSPEMHGDKVFFATLAPGDWLDLVDDTIEYLRGLTASST